ncbi:MAG: DUF3006 domain-containing protein [Candidatus Fermentibacteraceae bacterium]|nr:DUF3006 domain-containing protein [Candidatus Fermentibacteraceae bacterium]
MEEDGKFMVSLDRMEGSLAVLITVDGQSWLVPASHLPSDSREGDVLDVVFRRDPEETEKLAERVGDLQRRLLERTARRSDGKTQG